MSAGALGQFVIEPRAHGPLRLRHALGMFTSPGAVFARIEDTGAYGWALVTLLFLVLAIGYAQVQTGLIDQEVDRHTEKTLAELEASQGHLLDQVELSDQLESARKSAEFKKTISRLLVIVAAPAYFLASFLLIASFLYAVVALTGTKPEYHTLMSICVYAGFIELAAYALQLAMMLCFRTTQVSTTLGMLAEPGKPSILPAIDPFRIWFWVLVAMGLIITHQLSRRMAVFICALFCALSTGVRMAALALT